MYEVGPPRPPFEDWGTKLELTQRCPICGCGVYALPPYKYKLPGASSKQRTCSTWAGEWIVPQGIASALVASNLTGLSLSPIFAPWETKSKALAPWVLPWTSATTTEAKHEFVRLHRPENAAELCETLDVDEDQFTKYMAAGRLYFLQSLSYEVEVPDTVHFGRGPFGEPTTADPNCLATHYLGLSRYGQMRMYAPSNSFDVMATRKYIGKYAGLFHPYRELIVSRKFYEAVKDLGIGGWTFEAVEVE